MQRIVNLCRNGNAFITNIKVACDARENLRRAEEEELANIRQLKFEAEKKTAEKIFDEVGLAASPFTPLPETIIILSLFVKIEDKSGKAEVARGPHELHDVSEVFLLLISQINYFNIGLINIFCRNFRSLKN